MVDDQLEDTVRRGEARRRAALMLGVLALGALIIVALILMVGGTSSPSKQSSSRLFPGPGVTVQPPTSASSKPISTTSSRAVSSTPSALRSTGTTCTTVPGCGLAGDGGLLAALNALRAQHNLSPVTGTITSAAEKCAAANGDTPNCPGSYFWEPVTTQSGSDVLTKIAAQPSGTSFLLAPRLTSVAIGWVHAGNWNCALIAE